MHKAFSLLDNCSYWRIIGGIIQLNFILISRGVYIGIHGDMKRWKIKGNK